MGRRPKGKRSFSPVIIGIIVLAALVILWRVFVPGSLTTGGRETDLLPQEGSSELTEPQIKVTCPLDGALIDQMPVRPIAVTIDNFRLARPQAGLDQADLVYEIPVEGGITRYLAIFFHGQAKSLGPVRSARPYLVDLAREWDAVYIHAGESPEAQVYFKKEKIAHINEMFNPTGFWRDKSRKAPNNLYTSTDALWREITKRGWDRETEPESFLFLEDGEEIPGIGAGELTISYHYGSIGYQYDPQKGTYLRFLNNQPYSDLVSGVQLLTTNILIQQVNTRVFDQVGRLEVDLLGTGKAWLFTGGKVITGTWQKNSVSRRTRFYDETGNELKLRPGQTWIQIIPDRIKIEYQ